MGKKLKRFQKPIFILFILIAFLLSYSQYDSLGKIRFPFPLTFESFEDEVDGDEEDLAIDPPSPIRRDRFSFLCKFNLSPNSFLQKFPSFLFPRLFLGTKFCHPALLRTVPLQFINLWFSSQVRWADFGEGHI